MWVEVAGSRTFVHDGGAGRNPEAPALFLIHGAGQDHSYFRYQTRWFAHHRLRALAPDLPGHGRSEGEAATIEQMGDWLEGLADALGIERFSLLGHSMGSLVALEVAASSPSRVDHLFLTGPSAGMEVHPQLQQAADERDHLAVDLIEGWTHAGGDRFGGHANAGSWTRGITRRLNERHLDRLGADLSACARYDVARRAQSIECPVTLFIGSADRMTAPQGGLRLASLLREAECIEVEGAGHSILIDRPEQLNALVLERVAG